MYLMSTSYDISDIVGFEKKSWTFLFNENFNILDGRKWLPIFERSGENLRKLIEIIYIFWILIWDFSLN